MNIRIGLGVLAMLPMSIVCADEVADFTIHVPVNIENTIIWDIEVKCGVGENELGDTGTARVIGRGSASATVVDGNFNGTLTVRIDADPGKLPALARSYSCSLWAFWPLDPEVGYQEGGGHIGASPGNFRRAYEERGGRMLLSVTTRVEGRIEQ